MPCKCHQRIIRFSVTSTFKNFRSVWSVSVWIPRALTLELLVPFCFCGKGVQHENGYIWILLTGFGYRISHTTLLIWRRRKMCKGKDENKGSVGKQFQLDNSKSRLHISVLRQKKLLLCSLERCYSEFNVHMNRWGIFLKSRFWFCRSRVGPTLLHVWKPR